MFESLSDSEIYCKRKRVDDEDKQPKRMKLDKIASKGKRKRIDDEEKEQPKRTKLDKIVSKGKRKRVDDEEKELNKRVKRDMMWSRFFNQKSVMVNRDDKLPEYNFSGVVIEDLQNEASLYSTNKNSVFKYKKFYDGEINKNSQKKSKELMRYNHTVHVREVLDHLIDEEGREKIIILRGFTWGYFFSSGILEFGRFRYFDLRPSCFVHIYMKKQGERIKNIVHGKIISLRYENIPLSCIDFWSLLKTYFRKEHFKSISLYHTVWGNTREFVVNLEFKEFRDYEYDIKLIYIKDFLEFSNIHSYIMYSPSSIRENNFIDMSSYPNTDVRVYRDGFPEYVRDLEKGEYYVSYNLPVRVETWSGSLYSCWKKENELYKMMVPCEDTEKRILKLELLYIINTMIFRFINSSGVFASKHDIIYNILLFYFKNIHYRHHLADVITNVSFLDYEFSNYITNVARFVNV